MINEDMSLRVGRHPRDFAVGLSVIVVLALALRVAWVLIARRDFALHGDDYFYHWQANALADASGVRVRELPLNPARLRAAFAP